MTPLTVACVHVKANVPYSSEYVVRLHRMARRWITHPFSFVCFTDDPEGAAIGAREGGALEGFYPVKIPRPEPGVFGWWAKMELFNPAHGLTGRVLYLDLDSLIVGDLDPIIDFDASFALCPPGGNFRPRTHHATVRRFNSSVMSWEAADAARVWETYAADSARYQTTYWGDQDFLGAELDNNSRVMPAEWFPRLSACGEHGIPKDPRARVVLCKKPKNHIAAARWPWFARMWGEQ